MIVGLVNKKCKRCGKRFPATLEFFYKNKHSDDGLHTWCKSCVSEYQKERRAKKKKGKEHTFKFDMEYTVIVSQTQNCMLQIQARSEREAIEKAYEELAEGVYVDDLIFDNHAKLVCADLDVVPEPEDYVEEEE